MDLTRHMTANSGFVTIFQYQVSIFSRNADLSHNLKVTKHAITLNIRTK
jgi:hypothetical protein